MANIEMASINSHDPWLIARDRFIIDLNETERVLFNEATPENIYYSASNVQQADQKASRTRAILRSLDPFMKAVQDYAAAMDTFANIAPLNVGPIWGSIRVVLALANNHGKFYDRMIETFARIGDILPRLRDYQAIFDQRKYPRFTQTLSAAYLDIIVLCLEFRKVLLEQKSSFMKRAFKPLSPSLRSYLEKAVQTFRERREAVESEARICHMIEAKQARDLVLRNEMFIKAQEREQRQKRIIAQMATIDYRNKHRRMQKIRHQGTGKWLVDTHEYKSWKDCEKSCAMSFYGIPGSGKSVLISSLIDGSSSTLEVNTAVTYYYFDYADKRTLSPSSLFSCVAQQLLRSLKQIPDNLMEALEAEYPDGAGCPGVDQVIALLVKIIDEFPSVSIFIDGLDELPEVDRKLTFSSLRSLLTTVVSSTRLFVSSREDTSYLFPTPPTVKRYKLHVQPNSIAPDIDSYIQHSIEELISTGDLVLGSPKLKNVIFTTLKNGAQGMFLWVKFQLEDLCRMETDASIEKALQNLPRSLEETYDRLLGRIVEIERREYVKRMFDWIISSRRPLRTDELREAIAFTISDTFWDAAKIPNDLHRLVRSCGNLVVIDEYTEEVQLAHYTVEQYLLHPQNSTLSYFHTTRENSNCELGKVCIAYLSFTDFETQITMYRDWITPNMMVIEKAMTTHSLTPHAHHGSNLPSKATKAILTMRKQHEHTKLGIEYSRIIPKYQVASETMEKYRILSYVKDNWLLHTTGFTEKIRQGLVGQLFRQLLFEKSLIFRIKPWEKFSSTDVSKITLLGWAINESHLPLMEELIKHDENSFDFVEEACRTFWRYVYTYTCGQADSVPKNLMERMGIDLSDEMLRTLTWRTFETINSRTDSLFWLYKQILSACRRGDLKVIKACFEIGKLQASQTSRYPFELLPFKYTDIQLSLRSLVSSHLQLEAAINGHLELVRHLQVEKTYVWVSYEYQGFYQNALERAIGFSNQKISHFLAQSGCPVSNKVKLNLLVTEDLQSAVETGDLGKLRYYLDFLGKCSSSGVMARADYFGSEDWSYEWQICAYKLNAITAAAARGSHRAVDELLNCTILRESRDITERNTALLVAIKFFQHDIIQYLLSFDMQRHRCYWFFPIPPEVDHAQMMQEIYPNLNNRVLQNMSLLEVVVEKKLDVSGKLREYVINAMLEAGEQADLDDDIPLHKTPTWLIPFAIVRNKPQLVKRLVGQNTTRLVENRELPCLPDEIVKIVWPEGSDICEDHAPSLIWAVLYNRPSIVDSLSPRNFDSEQHTLALKCAIMMGSLAVVKILLRNNLTNHLPWDILEFASTYDRYSPAIRWKIMSCIVSMDPELWRERNRKAVELLERQEGRLGRGLDEALTTHIGDLGTSN